MGVAESLSSFEWHDWIGSLGAMMMVVAYYLLQSERVSNESIFYFALNGVGAILVLISLTIKFNFAAFLIEAFWLLISVMGLFKLLRRRAA